MIKSWISMRRLLVEMGISVAAVSGSVIHEQKLAKVKGLSINDFVYE
jgi:hypothetical protein